MGSDIARKTYDETRNYRRVIHQQGRVILEADLNESQEILHEEVRKQALDIVGPTGARDEYAPELWTEVNAEIPSSLVEPAGGAPFDIRVNLPNARPGDLPPDVSKTLAVTYSQQLPSPPIPPSNPGTELIYISLCKDMESPLLPAKWQIGRLGLSGLSTMTQDNIESCAANAFSLRGQRFDPKAKSIKALSRVHIRLSEEIGLGTLPKSIRIQITEDGEHFLWRTGRSIYVEADILPNGSLDLLKEAKSAVRKSMLGANRVVEIVTDAHARREFGDMYRVSGFAEHGRRVSIHWGGKSYNTARVQVLGWENQQPIQRYTWVPLLDSTGKATGIEIKLVGSVFVPGDYWILERHVIEESEASKDRKKAGISPTGPRRMAYPLAALQWADNGGMSQNISCLAPILSAKSPNYNAFTLGPGIVYIGGMRVEIRHALSSSAAERPGGTTPPLDLIYLELEEREISAVEDPTLREPALGGPDTSQRLRMMEKVGSLAVFTDDPLHELEQSYGTKGQLVRRDGRLCSNAGLMASFSSAGLAAGGEDLACEPLQIGGYLGSENQLVRLQISKTPGKILWAWDGGSTIYRATCRSDSTLELSSYPLDVHHTPRQGQFAEILQPEVDLGISTGNTHAFASSAFGRVAKILKFEDRTLSLENPGLVKDQTVFVRIWENEQSIPAPTTPLALESVNRGGTGAGSATTKIGLEVLLVGAEKTVPGDYWLVALRPGTPREVDPPRYLQAFQTPDGPRRWICPIALVSWKDRILTVERSLLPGFSDLLHLSSRVDTLETAVDSLKEQAQSLDFRTDKLEEDVENLQATTEQLVEETIVGLEQTDQSLQDQIDELSKGSGGYSRVVGPKQVLVAGGLQAVIDKLMEDAGGQPATLCLLAGHYVLHTPVRLGQKHRGLRIEGAHGGASIGAATEGGQSFRHLPIFRDGLFVLVHTENIRFQGLRFSLPLVHFMDSGTPLAGIPRSAYDQEQLAWSTALVSSIAIRTLLCGNIHIEACMFRFLLPSDPAEQAFGAGIFASGGCWALHVENCSFLHDEEYLARRKDGTTGQETERPNLLFGILQAPSATIDIGEHSLSHDLIEKGEYNYTVLHDALIHGNMFTGLGGAVLIQAQISNVRITHNQARDCYAGICLLHPDVPVFLGITIPERLEVALLNAGAKPERVVEEIVRATGMDNLAASALVYRATRLIMTTIQGTEADKIRKDLTDLGASVEVVLSPGGMRGEISPQRRFKVFLVDRGPNLEAVTEALTSIVGSEKAQELMQSSYEILGQIFWMDAVLLEDLGARLSLIGFEPPSVAEWYNGDAPENAAALLRSADDPLLQAGLVLAKTYPLPPHQNPIEEQILLQNRTVVQQPAQWPRFAQLALTTEGTPPIGSMLKDIAFVWYQFPYMKWPNLFGPCEAANPAEGQTLTVLDHLHRLLLALELGYASESFRTFPSLRAHIADNDIAVIAGEGTSGPALLILGAPRDNRSTAIISSNRIEANSHRPAAALFMVSLSTITGNIVFNEVALTAVPGPYPYLSAITGNILQGVCQLPPHAYAPPLGRWQVFNANR